MLHKLHMRSPTDTRPLLEFAVITILILLPPEIHIPTAYLQTFYISEHPCPQSRSRTWSTRGCAMLDLERRAWETRGEIRTGHRVDRVHCGLFECFDRKSVRRLGSWAEDGR